MTVSRDNSYQKEEGEVVLAVLMLQSWRSAFSSGVFIPTTVAGAGWDDDLESTVLSAVDHDERPAS